LLLRNKAAILSAYYSGGIKRNGFLHKKCTLKPPLTDANKLKRLFFAHKWMGNGVCTLDNVIWTDETRVASHPNNRRISVWTNQAETPIQVTMHSGGNSFMFWGCFSKHGTGPLVSLQETMNQVEYISVLRDKLIPEFQRAKRAISGTWRIMQDNAPCHTAIAVKAFLRQKRVELIEWPPYSPDLNPIENLWQWLKQKLETEYPVCESAEQIEARIFEIWGTVTPEMCSAFCENYQKRLIAVIAANGGYTKY
jgi:transposase